MQNNKSGLLIQFFAVLVASGLHFYWTWPAYAMNLFYTESNARVKSLTGEKLQIAFMSQFENEEISFTRVLSKQDKKEVSSDYMRVRYSRLLPNEVIIVGLDPIPKIRLLVFVHLVFLITILASARATVQAFRKPSK